MVIMIISITIEDTMITETNAVTFRQNLGEMINQVQFRRDTIVIKKDGKTVAALVDARLFERIRQMRERFDALAGRLAHAYANVPEEEGLSEIDRLAAKVRSQTPSKNARARKG
jgi:prevent-host-death family protein